MKSYTPISTPHTQFLSAFAAGAACSIAVMSALVGATTFCLICGALCVMNAGFYWWMLGK